MARALRVLKTRGLFRARGARVAHMEADKSGSWQLLRVPMVRGSRNSRSCESCVNDLLTETDPYRSLSCKGAAKAELIQTLCSKHQAQFFEVSHFWITSEVSSQKKSFSWISRFSNYVVPF